jgi:DNA segregation ATPase FtsK/SpoIIIE, S-DNA-T family
MEQAKKENGERKKNGDFGHEIWGIVYIATAVLVLVALVSHFVNSGGNILGQYLGTGLAKGMIFLFGKLPSFVFPGVIGYIGWLRLRGDQISYRTLILGAVLLFEVCILLAIPTISAESHQPSEENGVGVLMVGILKIFFGRNAFGPYFLTILALFITVVVSLRISPVRVARATAAAVRWIAAHVAALFHKSRAALEREEAERQKRLAEEQKAVTAPEPDADKAAKSRARKQTPAVAAAEGAPAAGDAAANAAPPEKEVDPAEEEKRRLFEQELAAFRSKKREPIQIMTVETADIETEEPQIDASRVKPEETSPEEETAPVKKRRGSAGAAAPADEAVAAPSDPAAEETVVDVPPAKPYEIPSAAILPDPPPLSSMVDKDVIEQNSMILEKTLGNFGVEGKVVSVSPGPVVTRYEIVLAPGVKISKVVNLHNDISMAVGGQPIRIEAPIPGKSAVGIELPNGERQIVYFKHILTSDMFTKSKAKLPVVIGTNISGAPYVADIFKMPHMLIAGQTGSGKSVCINSIICSLLMTKKPEELRLIMIDPKKVELSFYDGIPHLLSPVVTESKEAVKALHWGVGEMERRYRLLARVGARNIDSFNGRVGTVKFNEILTEEDNKPLPFIVILVDELADLMTKASKDVETLIQRIAQLARAVGIHLIVATQRPSVDIITGPIKANLTSRIAFRTIQGTDSRTILDQIGAEKLLGLGDMLFLRNGAPQVERFHGAFISEEDVEKVVAEVRKQKVQIYKIESFTSIMGGDDDEEEAGGVTDGTRDELFEEAARMIVDTGLGSTSLLQRRLNLGYARAGRLMDQLYDAGIVGPPNGSKAREVIARTDEIDDVLAMLRGSSGK